MVVFSPDELLSPDYTKAGKVALQILSDGFPRSWPASPSGPRGVWIIPGFMVSYATFTHRCFRTLASRP